MRSVDKYKERCMDCAYLAEGNLNEWLCECCEHEDEIIEIHNVSFEESNPNK